LKQATQQRILKVLNQMLADVTTWLCGAGLSEADATAILDSILRENGLMARYIHHVTSSVLRVNGAGNLGAEQAEQEFARLRSGDLATSLLSEPEPLPEELNKILFLLRNALPKVREHFEGGAKLGPHHRRGGRLRKIDDPVERKKIREIIKKRRGPGVKLNDLYQSLADAYDVSPTTIKRIRFEKLDQT
jgi:hypothetical protein